MIQGEKERKKERKINSSFFLCRFDEEPEWQKKQIAVKTDTVL